MVALQPPSSTPSSNHLSGKYHLTPKPLRMLWLQHRLAEVLASYISQTAYIRPTRLLHESHRATGLPTPSPVERLQLILDALELREILDARGRTWLLQGKYTPGRGEKKNGKNTYLVYTRY